jgi:hypothetical protein
VNIGHLPLLPTPIFKEFQALANQKDWLADC